MKLSRLILCCVTLVLLHGFACAKESYKLSPNVDIPLAVTSLLVAGGGGYLYSQMSIPEESDRKTRADLLPWDRKFAGRYNETADFMSDVGSLFALAPFAIGGIAWHSGSSNSQEFLTFSTMLVQSLLFQHGINVAFRSLEIWPRPYIFADEGKGKIKAENAKAEAYGSFFSGHASAAFTIAVFTSEWFSEISANPDAIRVTRALAFSLAGLESVLRVAAGKHYPTDILVGALVGTGVSYGVLAMHKTNHNNFSFWVAPNMAGVTFRL